MSGDHAGDHVSQPPRDHTSGPTRHTCSDLRGPHRGPRGTTHRRLVPDLGVPIRGPQTGQPATHPINPLTQPGVCACTRPFPHYAAWLAHAARTGCRHWRLVIPDPQETTG